MAAISVQQGGGGDYTTLEAAVENASTVDGDVITISGTWSSRENTRIAVADALTIVATGDSKQIGIPWRTGDTHYQHRSTSAGHSFTITDTGAVTFEDLDIILDHTGVSDEIFRNNIANTFVARRCVLGFGVAGGTDQQDVFYTETTVNATFENCMLYNVYRGVVDMTGAASGTVNINSCTAYSMGFSNSQTSRSGLVGKNSTGTTTINIFNTLCHMNNINYPVCTNSTAANTTGNVERLVTNSTVAPIQNVPATTSYAGNVEDAVINATDTSGNYIVTSITSPYDLTLLDSANNAAIGAHSDGTGGGLTMPSTDILGTTRSAPYDIGAFEVVVSSGVSGTVSQTLEDVTSAASGVVPYTGTINSTLEDFTSTASGTLTASGSISETLDDAASAASGLITVSGSSSNLLLDVISTSSGLITVTGSVSQTLEDFTSTAAGTVGGGVSGSIAITLTDVISTATGVVPYTGTISETLENATSVGTGSITVSGSIAETLDDTAISSTGLLTVTGTITELLDNTTSNFAGSVTVTGTINEALNDVLSTASGSVFLDVTGSINSVLEAFSSSGSGSVTVDYVTPKHQMVLKIEARTMNIQTEDRIMKVKA